jgi:hypothetical protein
MGLFTSSRERRYNAAVAIHLAAYTFSMMASNERAIVDDKVYADMNGAVVGFSAFEFQRLFPPHVKAAWRAYAMADLGISPAIEGDVWRLPKSRRILWGSPKNGPTKLFANYRPNDEATMRAKSYLEAKGLKARYLELSTS